MRLDVQNGQLDLGSGRIVGVSADDMVMLYWRMRGAPDARIACALDMTADEVRAGFAELEARTGGLDYASLVLMCGSLPEINVPWTRRTMASAISEGLTVAGSNVPYLFDADGEALPQNDIAQIVQRIRRRFRAAKICKGDHIAIDLCTTAESYLLYLAALADGIVVIVLGETIVPEPVREFANGSSIKLIFTARREQLSGVAKPNQIIDLDRPEDAVFALADWLDELAETDAADPVPVNVAPSDPAVKLFTSGSTGQPKLVDISHEAYFSRAFHARLSMELTSDDVFYNAVEVTTTTAQRCLILSPRFSVRRHVMASRVARRSPVALVKECEAHGVKSTLMVPSAIRTLLELKNNDVASAFSKLKLIATTTGPVDRASSARVANQFGVKIFDRLSSSEAGFILQTSADSDDVIGDGGGVPMGVLLRILDSEGRPVRPGEVGEICVHGDMCMTGYAGLPDAPETSTVPTATHIPGHQGWYPTGDLARFNAHGRVELAGRKRDVIKAANGEMVFPFEIERVLSTSDDVRDACAFRVVLRNGTEQIGAAIIPVAESMSDELSMRLRKLVHSEIGPFRTPANILVVDEFPRVARGKPDKAALMQVYLDRFGDHHASSR